jgi:hypothetical protein
VNGTVAVVVRSGGQQRLLARAVESVRAQTVDDWALVLALPDDVDRAHADRVAATDARISVVQGAGRGRLANTALASVDSELAVLHDEDGSWAPGFLEHTVAFLKGHPDHVGVAVRAEVVHELRGPGGAREERRELLAHDEQTVSLASLLSHNYVPPASFVYRRAVHAQAGGYDESLPALEDWEFLLRVLARGPVGFLPDDTLAGWHLEADSDEAGRVSAATEPLVRDQVLRRDLAAGAPGLGLPLVLGHQLSTTADRWGRAHREHLDVVTTDIRLELGRLRGELVLMRELLTETQEDIALLGEQVEEALRTGRAADALRRLRAQGRTSLPVRAVRRAGRRVTEARAARVDRRGRSSGGVPPSV